MKQVGSPIINFQEAIVGEHATSYVDSIIYNQVYHEVDHVLFWNVCWKMMEHIEENYETCISLSK